MASSNRAPKQWCLTKHETVNTFESWRQNLIYTLSMDSNFAPFLDETRTWLKKSKGQPLRGMENDPGTVPENQRKTAAQKVAFLELMLGQIANYCPIISRNTIVKNSTSISAIWQSIRSHFGFQSTGAHFLDLAEIRLEPGERPEDLFQRLMAFADDNLLTKACGLTHHDDKPTEDEELTPSVENFIVLTWLRLVNTGLPRLVKQRYGTELRSRTLASIKPEISQALDSLLDELQSSEEVKILRSSASSFRLSNRNAQPGQQHSLTSGGPTCPLCKQVGRRETRHFLSKCKFLPESDRKYLTKTRCVQCDEGEAPEETVDESEDGKNDSPPVRTSRVHVKKSPFIHMFHRHTPVCITIDSGAETNMIKDSLVQQIGAKVTKSTQCAVQADGGSPLHVTGETRITLTRGDLSFQLEALVVSNLDGDILAGVPFMEENDVGVRPAKQQITFGDGNVFHYGSQIDSKKTTSIRRAQAYILRAPSVNTTIWPGGFLEVPLPPNVPKDVPVALEPRPDLDQGCTQWFAPDIAFNVDGRVRIPNHSPFPQVVGRHAHFGQVMNAFEPGSEDTDDLSTPASTATAHMRTVADSSVNYSGFVKLDEDNILSSSVRSSFNDINKEYNSVFSPTQHVYNGASGPFRAVVNMGPVLPPQRKGRVPQYARDKLVELQQKFDELEADGVFARPEDVGITVEYLNPSFLVKKASGGYRLVTAFAEVGRYSKPQPSLMPNVDSTLRAIAQWRYLIATDMSSAFFQIPLSRSSYKFCGVVTPFRGVRVYTRSAMGMPGSETALEELTCRLLGDLLQEGVVCKMADDLYIGANTPDELLVIWRRVLDILSTNGIGLSPRKTVICPKSTTILGWIWEQGRLSANPHRIAPLATCAQPQTVGALRSFIGAYKVLARVIPNCATYISPLDAAAAGCDTKDKIPWSSQLSDAFTRAQRHLSSNRAITLPRPTDQLWIVTDGSVSHPGMGATLYVTRNGEKPKLAGFFSAKLLKRQLTWLPCEIEALAIASATKHFAPYIVQSKANACVLTDSKPCVQAYEKLCRGEFSTSPRVATFLSTVSRYQMSVRHLAGSANLPSDFASRNALECTEDSCQICTFISRYQNATVLAVSVQDIESGKVRLPFTSRPAWLLTQNECPNLRRAHAHLAQGTRPSKKLTNIHDVKRYVNACSLSRDGLVIHRRDEPFAAARECIAIPRDVLPGLLTALHIRLDHPSTYQLKQVFRRYFFALDMDKAIDLITTGCHQCASLQRLPTPVVTQSSDPPPTAVGQLFAADVIKRCRQLVFVVRECVTSYTVACFIPDERKQSLQHALISLCLELRPSDGPPAIVRCDSAPGLAALRDDEMLRDSHISLEFGRTKNRNKNPVAERAIQELEYEIKRQHPEGGSLLPVQLSSAVAMLNSRVRSRGLSAREMWFQRDQYTNEQLPVKDRELILSQHEARIKNHPYSEKSKNPSSTPRELSVQVGDLVYLYSDGDKVRSRPRYLVVSITGNWCSLRKFCESQFRGRLYEVKVSECHKVTSDFNCVSASHGHREVEEDSESSEESSADPVSPPSPPPVPHTLTSLPLAYTHHPDGSVPDAPGTVSTTPDVVTSPPHPRRSTRHRTKPVRFPDYVTY